jgi:hypothetical protein
MAGKQGSGTVNPPGDSDDVAPVIPLRQRQDRNGAHSGARGSLPREHAPFDPEIEPGDVALKRRPHRRVLAQLMSHASGVRPRTAPLSQSLVVVLLGVGACLVVGSWLVLQANSTSPRRDVSTGTLGHSGTGRTSQTRPNAAALPKRPPSVKTRTLGRRRPASGGPKGNRTSSTRHRARPSTESPVLAPGRTQTRSSATTTATATSPVVPTEPSTTSVDRRASPSGSTAHGSSSSTPAFGAKGALGPGSSGSS